LELVKHLFFACLGYIFYGFAVLVPTHYFAGGRLVFFFFSFVDCLRFWKGPLTGTASISMANVPDGSTFFVADIIGVFLNSIWVIAVLYHLFVTVTRMRERYRMRVGEEKGIKITFLTFSPKDRPENFTVQIRELPPNASEEDVASLFDNAFRNEIVHVQLAYDTPALEKHLDIRQRVGLKEEEMQAILVQKGERKTARTCAPFYLCGEKVDGIDFFKQRYEEESQIVQSKIEKIPRVAKHQTNFAFVTFSSIGAAKKAMQTRLQEKMEMGKKVLFIGKFRLAPIGSSKHFLDKSFTVEPAPHPRDVFWTSLKTGHLNRYVRW
jgi:hypothetical protein